MSRDASGTYNLPAGNPVVSGSIIATSWANPTMADLAAALTDSLSRSGKGGMAAPLVMNGYKVVSLGFATAATDAPQAVQVRDQTFSNVSVTVDATGNNYVGTTLALQGTPPNNGGIYNFLTGQDNTGPMTLAVNGGAALPILINGAPTPPGLVRAAAIVQVIYVNLTYRIVGVVSGASGTVNSVQSTDPALLSVVNDSGTNIATLTPHANVAGGMVKLDGGGKVPVVQLPFTDLHYIGIWNAAPGTLPSTSGITNGNFYIITVAGTLSLFRVSGGGNVYTAQATPVVVGDSIILRAGSTDPNQPNGWYYDPLPATSVVASTVAMTPTATLPAVTNVQAWMTQMDPIIAAKLPLAGGTMTGPILQPAAPATSTALANRQYVDDKTAALVGVLSFNSRTGSVALTSSDVTGALGYAPVNRAGDTITGNLVVNGNLSAGGGVGAVYFQPVYFINDAFPASGTIEFLNGQSQRLTMTANTVITAINSIPQGAMLRIILRATTFTVTWPANVHWPLGIAPSLGAGPTKIAVIVFEQIDTGGQIAASATVY